MPEGLCLLEELEAACTSVPPQWNGEEDVGGSAVKLFGGVNGCVALADMRSKHDYATIMISIVKACKHVFYFSVVCTKFSSAELKGSVRRL